MEKNELLSSSGSGRGKIYHLSGLNTVASADNDDYREKMEPLFLNPPDIVAPAISDVAPVIRDQAPAIRDQAPAISDQAPVITVNQDDQEEWQELINIASEIRGTQRAQKEDMERVLLALCEHYYLTTHTLASLLNRDENRLRRQYLKPMVETEKLLLAYPDSPNHPQQGYKTFPFPLE